MPLNKETENKTDEEMTTRKEKVRRLVSEKKPFTLFLFPPPSWPFTKTEGGIFIELNSSLHRMGGAGLQALKSKFFICPLPVNNWLTIWTV